MNFSISILSSSDWIYGAGQQVPALGGKVGQQSAFLSAATTCNVFARIIIGFGSDYTLVKLSLPRWHHLSSQALQLL